MGGKIDDLGCGATCMKCLLFIFNIIFFISGGVLLGLGIWILVDPNVNDYITVVQIDDSDPYIRTAIYILMAAGAFILLVGFLGCCGACKESACMLCWYAMLVVVILVAEITSAIILIVYQDEFGKELETHMKSSVIKINDTRKGDPLTVSWHAMQITLKCCGANGYRDYYDNENFDVNKGNYQVPVSCCVLKNNDPLNPEPVDDMRCFNDARKNLDHDTHFLYTKGCYGELKTWFQDYKSLLIGIAFGVAFLQILGVIFACCVRSAINKVEQYEF